MSTLLALNDLQFRWEKGAPLVIDIPRFEIARGARVFLHGPSGYGKTTLLNLIGGVLKPSRGQIKILGEDLCALSGRKRDHFRADHIGFIFQQLNLVPYLSMLENVLLAGTFSRRRLRQLPQGVSPEQAAVGLLQQLGLGDTAAHNRSVAKLSVGQQQRVAAARALFGSPDLIIADEPTSALDRPIREEFLKLLFEATARVNATLLFVSHDQELAKLFDSTLDLTVLNQREQGRLAS